MSQVYAICKLDHFLDTLITSYYQLCPSSLFSSYTPEIKYSPPYYISPIEMGLLWAKITYLKIHSKALAFNLQTDTK